jgi:putative pyruvate formate lyase activating enzyme
VTPAYRELHASGELEERITLADELLRDCVVCPQHCHVDRIAGELGFCRSGRLPIVSSYGPHFGEEPPLVGSHGSGTVFLSHCNMRCEFCQNYDISQCNRGLEVSYEELAGIMVRLQQRGCHNINFVSPSHFVPQILHAVSIAAASGLKIPLVYNSGGYDSADTLKLLDGVIDIYMPDAKYGRDDVALLLSHAPMYTEWMKDALKEMHRQVGDLVIQDGLAVKGMIIRHLVLPENLADTETVMTFIAEEISRDSYVNIMAQYHPAWHVVAERENEAFRPLRRPITQEEYRNAIRSATRHGLHRGFPRL